VIIAVMTGEKFQNVRLPSIKESYASSLPEDWLVLYFTDTYSSEHPESIVLDAPKTYDGNFERMFLALDHIGDRYCGMEWVIKLDDDTNIHVPNLVRFLGQLDPSQLQLVGICALHHHTTTEGSTPFTSGGPGHYISGSLFKALHDRHWFRPSKAKELVMPELHRLNDVALGRLTSLLASQLGLDMSSFLFCNERVFLNQVETQKEVCLETIGCVATHRGTGTEMKQLLMEGRAVSAASMKVYPMRVMLGTHYKFADQV